LPESPLRRSLDEQRLLFLDLLRWIPISALVGIMAGTDPPAAVNFVSGLPSGQDKNGMIQNLAAQWAQNDVPGALAWVEKMPPSPAKSGALEQIASAWAQNDPKAAAAYLANLPEGEDKNMMVRNVATQWAQNDAPGALAFVMVIGSTTCIFAATIACASSSPASRSHRPVSA